MKFKILLNTFLFTLLIFSCSEDEPSPRFEQEVFDLYLEYWNPAVFNPQIHFDESISSPEVQIDFAYTFEGFTVPPDMTNIELDNVRIENDKGVNYRIDSMKVYELRPQPTGWIEDVEFNLEHSIVDNIDIMMVLDNSQSLGNDFETVKAYSLDFINRIYNTMPNARIGIVGFSDQVSILNLTNDQTNVTQFVNNMVQGQFTHMYDGMNKAIDLLNLEQTTSKILITFTDGVDNGSVNSADDIFDALKTPLGNNVYINSFIIGLDGKGVVDRPALELLSPRGGVEFLEHVYELPLAFRALSRAITSVYSIVYIRNQQQISIANAVSLRFKIWARPQKDENF